MRGKRSNSNNQRTVSKKVKRSKKFWQQRKTNTICQVPTSDSENDEAGSIEGNLPEEEPTTEYQKLLETFSNAEGANKIVVDSENENSEESENDNSEESENETGI